MLLSQNVDHSFIMDGSAVEFKKMIGRGSFGDVFLAMWKGREAAVKFVAVRSADDQTLFTREVATMRFK
jgi:serine/threonine protein kinase